MSTNPFIFSPVPITPDIAAAFDPDQCDDVSHSRQDPKVCNTVNKCIVVKRDTHRWAIVHDYGLLVPNTRVPRKWHSRERAPVHMSRLASDRKSTAAHEMARLVAIAALMRERGFEKREGTTTRINSMRMEDRDFKAPEVEDKGNERQENAVAADETQQIERAHSEPPSPMDSLSNSPTYKEAVAEVARREGRSVDQSTTTSCETSERGLPIATPTSTPEENKGPHPTPEEVLTPRIRKMEREPVYLPPTPSEMEDGEDWEFLDVEPIDCSWTFV